jgi:hypothetical protein
MADDTQGARQPYIGQIVAYHPGHDEGLGHAVRPALVTELARSGGHLKITLSVFLPDGRLAPRVHPVDAATAAGPPSRCGYWDFLPQ